MKLGRLVLSCSCGAASAPGAFLSSTNAHRFNRGDGPTRWNPSLVRVSSRREERFLGHRRGNIEACSQDAGLAPCLRSLSRHLGKPWLVARADTALQQSQLPSFPAHYHGRCSCQRPGLRSAKRPPRASSHGATAAGSTLTGQAVVASSSLFVLEAADLERLMTEQGLGSEDCLAQFVQASSKLARPPISDFHVSSIGLGVSGRAYLGVNLEFPGLPLHHSVHAEQFMVANAIQHGERQLACIVVTHAPCGHCRQFLSELRGAGAVRIVIADQQRDGRTLSEFLPHRFGPHDLLEEDFPLLMEPRHNGLRWPASPHGATQPPSSAASVLPSDSPSPPPPPSALQAALEAANASYAPYSGCPSGVALLTASGQVYAGAYMESAAFNPSLPPLQAALVALVSRGGGPYSSIVQAVLVERRGGQVQFDSTVRLALEKIAPAAALHVCHVEAS